jgi:hypothetical protein
MKAELMEARALCSALNQRASQWNSGASHMSQAFPKSFLDRPGLVSPPDTALPLQCDQ